MKLPIALLGVLVIATQGAPRVGSPSLADVWRERTLARDAAAAVTRGDWASALEKYGTLRARHPGAAEIPYNMGVAAYRQGDLESASRHFRDAARLARDPSLKSRAAYNLGTTAYAQSLQDPAEGPDPNAAIDDAMTSLSEALEQYRTTLKLDPADEDARVNGELAQRRLDQLQAMQDAMQQSSPDDQQQGDESSPSESGEENEQEGERQDGQQGQRDQQDQPDGQGGESGEPEPSSPPGGPEENGEPQSQTPPPAPEETEEPGQPAPADAADGEPETPREAGSTPSGMSREEAERLLQSVRDKERERNRARAAARASKLPPVDKDW